MGQTTPPIVHFDPFSRYTLDRPALPAGRLALHEAGGFRRVGRRERLGRLAGIWRDVILLERRSDRVGT